MPEENSAADTAARMSPRLVSEAKTQFDELYREQGSPVRNFLRLATGSNSAAEELTQETFLHLWRRPHSFDPTRGGIRAYLLGIARKKAADWWRVNRQAAAQPSEPETSAPDGLLIRDALKPLPEDLRSMLWLREVEGHSYEELAAIFHIPIGTVRSRLHSARQQLRTIWMKEAK